MFFNIFDNPKHANHRCGEDRSFWIFVIEAYISARYRCIESAAGITHSAQCLFKRPVNLRLIGIPEIEAVRNSHRFGAAAHYIACRLRHGDLSAFSRIQINVPSVTIGFGREPFFGSLHANHPRITRPWAVYRIGAHHRVILLIGPFF